jgi:hypothetical protein
LGRRPCINTKYTLSTSEQESPLPHDFLAVSNVDPEPESLPPLKFDQCCRQAYNQSSDFSSYQELLPFDTDPSLFSGKVSFGLGQWECQQKCTFHTQEEECPKPFCSACSAIPDLRDKSSSLKYISGNINQTTLSLPIQEQAYIAKLTFTELETTQDLLPPEWSLGICDEYETNVKQIRIPIDEPLKLTKDYITNAEQDPMPSLPSTNLVATSGVELPHGVDEKPEQTTPSPLVLSEAPAGLGLGQWVCQKCTFHNEKDRPRHNCAACSSTPDRKAKQRPTKYPTRHTPILDRRESSFSADTVTEYSDGDDHGYVDVPNECKIAHPIDPFQNLGASAVKRNNRKINLEWINRDPLPITNVPSSMWYTVLAPPRNINVYQKLMPLDDVILLKKTLSSSWFAVQKGSFQVVGAWSLDRILHGVVGKKGMQAFASQAGASVLVLQNDVNHHCKNSQPNRPIVVNTNDIRGCSDSKLLSKFGFSDVPGLLSLSYLQQMRQVFHKFLSKHANEFIRYAEMDSRGTLSLHAGPSPRDGSGWIRFNGRGIAQPGLRKGTAGLSESMRKDMGQMCLFLVEILLRKMMTGSNRDKQCVPDEYRSALNDIWREHLCYPSDLGDRVARIGEGSTLNIGQASLLHYDYLNDPTHLFDNISWLSNIVEDFTTHISPSSIAKCASKGVLL